MMLPRVSALDATWAVAFGLCRWGYAEDMMGNSHPLGDIVSRMLDAVKQVLGRCFRSSNNFQFTILNFQSRFNELIFKELAAAARAAV